MKRVADKQLSKDDVEGDEEDEEVGTGFKKADDTVLAKRQIRGLPKRSLTGASTAPLAAPSATSTKPEEPAAPGKFAGFSGFGSSTTSSKPFSFSAPSAAPNPPKASAPSASPFSFTSTASSQPTSLFGAPSASSATTSTTNSQPSSLFGAPVSSSASAATKAFASIVSSSSAPPAPAPAVPTDTTAVDEKEIEYYKALRGLNVSLLAAISKAIEEDPFVDVADLLERYKSLRVSAGSGFTDKPKAISAPSAGFGSTALTPTNAETKSEPPASSFAMPAPPTSFSGFTAPGTSSTTSTTSTSSSGPGFVPKFDTGSTGPLGSPFSFAPSKPASESTPASDAPKSAFNFGSSSASSASNTSASNPFTFGAPSSGPSLFGKPASSSSSSAPSLFGSSASGSSSIFGGGGSGGSLFGRPADALKDKDKDADESSEAKEPASTPSSSFFGSGAGTNPFATSTPGKTSASASSSSPAPFSFGSASPGKAALFGVIPKAGSIGNPVGFGFGSPPKTPEAESASGPVKALPFSFGGSAPKPAADAAEEKKEEGGTSGEGTPAPVEDAPAPAALPASGSVHDQEGEGEEDEETTHEIRSKVYKMTKDKDGKTQWGDLGVGVLRLKKHKETEARRMLLRNSSTGKITINFILHSGMNASVADKVVSFMGHEDGRSTPYRVRTKTSEQAKELKEALDREIEFVRAKSET